VFFGNHNHQADLASLTFRKQKPISAVKRRAPHWRAPLRRILTPPATSDRFASLAPLDWEEKSCSDGVMKQACSGVLICGFLAAACLGAPAPPYPRSEVITGITFEENTLVRSAPGSDIWSCTWAADDRVYAAWGDGGGFGGSDDDGRVSIGVASLTGQPPEWKGTNVWGGLNPLSKQNPTIGKGTIVALPDRLYLYVSEEKKWNRCRLWKSTDYGISWEDRGWIFPESHKVFAFPGLIEFGRAQQLNREGYLYGISDNDPGRVNDGRLYLFRVRPDRIEDLNGYEYFSGSVDAPQWSSNLEARKPVFQNAAGIGWGATCVYHPATRRFLLSVSVHPDLGDWGLYEAEHPWGPWKTVAYGEDFPAWTYSPAEKQRPAYLHSFPTKWMGADGKTIWCVFDRGDHFNLARCELRLRLPKTPNF
jgi:hypothetical protein